MSNPINTQPVRPPQQPKVSIKGALQWQLKMSPVKMTLFELLQQSESYREAMNQILQEIQVDISNPDNFISIVESLKISQQPSITFYEQERLSNDGPGGLDPPLHIIGKVDGKLFKRILVDEGSAINIISNAAYKNLNLPDSLYLSPLFTN